MATAALPRHTQVGSQGSRAEVCSAAARRAACGQGDVLAHSAELDDTGHTDAPELVTVKRFVPQERNVNEKKSHCQWGASSSVQLGSRAQLVRGLGLQPRPGGLPTVSVMRTCGLGNRELVLPSPSHTRAGPLRQCPQGQGSSGFPFCDHAFGSPGHRPQAQRPHSTAGEPRVTWGRPSSAPCQLVLAREAPASEPALPQHRARRQKRPLPGLVPRSQVPAGTAQRLPHPGPRSLLSHLLAWLPETRP